MLMLFSLTCSQSCGFLMCKRDGECDNEKAQCGLGY